MEDIPKWLRDELENNSTNSNNIENLTTREVAEKAIREGRIKIDDERAVIRCPNTREHTEWVMDGTTLTDNITELYACPVYPAPDPDNPGETKMVCGGPMATRKDYEEDNYSEYTGGCSRARNCPYHPDRL